MERMGQLCVLLYSYYGSYKGFLIVLILMKSRSRRVSIDESVVVISFA